MMGWFSAVIERHPRRVLVGAMGVAAAMAVATVLLVGTQAAFASHPEVSLPGSNFEIDTDANLKVDDPAPSIDWASVTEVRKADEPTGQQDDSFGQGTKEDTKVPTVVNGSIPNNKSDLLDFGVYLEQTSAGKNFLTLFWHRVQEPTGTTNMDFEFNQSKEVSSNGVTPVRTAGDILIQYDLAQGGTNPQLFLSKWVTSGPNSLCQAANSTPCWGDRIDLTASADAAGSINTSAIPEGEADGLGAISPRTFGEAHIDFDAIAPSGSCNSFATAYLKSRASDSFTAAMKDFIAPVETGFANCKSLSTTQKFTPQDEATITGGTGTISGSVTFDLYHSADCTGSSLNTSTGSVSNGKATSSNTYAIDKATEGDYSWKVTYTDGSTTLTSCEESSNVSIDNGGTVTQT